MDHAPDVMDDGDVEQGKRRKRDDRGAGLVEYVLMISLITLVCIAAVGYFQEATRGSFDSSASAVQEAGG